MPPKKRRFSSTREIAVEREFLRHVADALRARASGSLRHVDAGDQHARRPRAQQAAEDADDGRFAGAVGAEEAHDLAAPDAKADVVHGGEAAEPLDQVLGDDLRLG